MFEVHPYADLFPMCGADDIAILADDIADNGQIEPVVLLDGKVLDGRHRVAACDVHGLVPDCVDYEGGDPLGFVLSKNLHRRHLSESQRAMVAAELVSRETGINQHTRGAADLPPQEAAKKLSVSARLVRSARHIKRYAAPEVIEAVASGKVSVNVAQDIARVKQDVQREIIATPQANIIAAAKLIRRKRQEESHAGRLRVHASISARSADLPSGQRWPVAYVDPPWKQEVYGEVTGQEKGAVNHYPTMEWEYIHQLCEGEKSPFMSDAILYLWIPANNIHTGLITLERWGFEYKSQMIWDKVRQGTGRYVFDRHEVLLIGRRGDFPAPLAGSQPQSLHSEARGKHSRKPVHFAETIERCYPGVPKLEMFNRKQSLEPDDLRLADHWTLWGNEAVDMANTVNCNDVEVSCEA